MFVDKVQVKIKAGDGGNGVVAWRRERYIDRGGPSGGDGGHGGNVVFKASETQNTLAKFRFNQLIEAKNGQPGAKQNKHGASAEDLIVEVPVGTQVYRDEEFLADLTQKDQEVIIARGGEGGFGNAHFKSSVRQAPKVAEKGEPGEEFEATLELKLIADVGLVGLPNAGKSTFLSVVSNAKPKIADYQFTTLEPNLGVADVDGESLLIADIPGLIEGAAKGKGLGDEFLRHVERTAVLIHLVDAHSSTVGKDYQTVQKELAEYDVDLSTKPHLTVLSKVDGLDDEILDAQTQELKSNGFKGKVYRLSSHSKDGLTELLRASKKAVEKFRSTEEVTEEATDGPILMTLPDTDRWDVTKKGNKFIVTGRKIEKFAVRTNFDTEAGERRLRDIMKKMGIMHELRRQKISEGDVIQFGRHLDQKIKY